MPAAPRGQNRRGDSGSKRAAASYAPLKLSAARRLGLSPLAALNAAGAVLALGLFAVLFTGARAGAAVTGAGEAVDGRMAIAGYRVERLVLQGVSAQARPDVLAAADVVRGDPILGLNLNRIRSDIEATGWAKSARVTRLLPDTLVISVVQAGHMAVWQRGGRQVVIDGQGEVLAGVDPAAVPDLPLVVGEGANTAAADMLPHLAGRTRLTGRLEALVRVDGRRWDLRLKDGTIIQLPAGEVEAAMLRLDLLDRRSQVLDLGLGRIDLRNPDMVVVRPRLTPTAGTLAVSAAPDAQG